MAPEGTARPKAARGEAEERGTMGPWMRKTPKSEINVTTRGLNAYDTRYDHVVRENRIGMLIDLTRL